MTNENKPSPSQHPWEQYLPSKRIQKILLVIIVIIIGYSLWKPVKKLISNLRQNIQTENKTTTTLPMPVVEQSNTPISIDKDTDGDGLADWQETLIGTDPKIPNSESDVPKDVRELLTKNTGSIITTEDKLALNIYQRLLTEPKGENIQEAIQAATAKEILDLANSIDQQYTNYGYDDINLVDNSVDINESYKTAINSLNKTLSLDEQTAQEIYNALLTGQKSINLSTFQIKINQSIVNLLQMPVPLTMADLHLNLLNALVHINSVLSSGNINSTESSLLYASFLIFQKNVNTATQTVDAIIQILNS